MNLNVGADTTYNFNGRYSNVKNMLNEFGKELGEGAKKDLNRRIEQAANTKNSGLIYDKAKDIIEITPQKKSVHIIKTLTYPVNGMPQDIINYSVNALKAKKPFKNSKILENISELKLLKNRRIELENLANTASIEKSFELFKNGEFDNDFFKTIHGRLNLKSGNYDSTNERALTRLFTGIVPAFFLSNDAYNLSIFVTDDKKTAETTKKRRFKQEATRIGITSMATLLALKLFSNASNKSSNACALIITAVTVISEILGRKLAGNPFWFVDNKKAQKYAQKRNLTETSTQKPSQNENKDESILNAKNVIKVLTSMLAVGFGADMLSKTPFIKQAKKQFLNSYNSFLRKEYSIKMSDFNEITDKLRQNGLEGLAAKYENIADDIIKSGNLTAKEKKLLAKNPTAKLPIKDNTVLNLGEVIDKPRYIAVHQILTFPLRYAWSILNFPYAKIVKPTVQKLTHTGNKLPKTVQSNENQILIDSLSMLKKHVKKDNFGQIVNDKIFSSLDSKTKSSLSNASLSTKTKKIASIASSTFLIADNYNSVMIETQGKDKDLAVQKGKERAVQRIVRIIYGAFFTTLFNSVFEGIYNGSMFGAQAVNIVDSFVLETMERKAVGLPVGKSSREGIIELENEYLNAKGLKGTVSRFMAKLTGKKPITQRTQVK